MKKLFLFLSVLSTVAQGICQEGTYKIQGTILDEINHNPLAGATIIYLATGKGAISDARGDFTISFDKFPADFSIRFIGYFEDTIHIPNSDIYQQYFKDKEIEIVLRQNLFEMDEVVVSAKATKLFAREPFAIMDFVILGDRILSLGFRNYNPLRSEIMLSHLTGKVITTRPLKGVREFYADCLGQVYAVAADSAYLMSIGDKELKVEDACDQDFFTDFIQPLKYASDRVAVMQKISENQQVHDYIAHDLLHGKQFLFYRVGQVRKERAAESIDQGIRREYVGKINQSNITSEQMRAINGRIAQMHYELTTDYRTVHSTLFQLADSLLLFDFENAAIFTCPPDGDLRRISEIGIDVSKDFTGRVIRDPVQDRYFLEFLHMQASYLIEIDPKTGLGISQKVIPDFQHIDRLQVYNGVIFFLYQPDIGDRAKKLYFMNY